MYCGSMGYERICKDCSASYSGEYKIPQSKYRRMFV